MGQDKPIKIRAELKASYTLTASYAEVGTGEYRCVAPKDGYYDLKAQFVFRAAANSDDCLAALAINGNNIVGNRLAASSTAGAVTYWPFTLCEDGIWLNTGDVVAVYSKYSTAGGRIDIGGGAGEAYIQITRR